MVGEASLADRMFVLPFVPIRLDGTTPRHGPSLRRGDLLIADPSLIDFEACIEGFRWTPAYHGGHDTPMERVRSVVPRPVTHPIEGVPMTARLLLEVALRVLGLWVLLNALLGITSTGSLFLSEMNLHGDVGMVDPAIWSSGTTVGMHFMLGVLLIWLAPAISASFYPQDLENEALEVRIGPGDVYRVACFVLGAYLVVQGAQSAANTVVTGFDRQLSGFSQPQLIQGGINASIYFVSGLLLVFGSRPISELLLNLRYDPETIPQQQLSIAALLVVLVAVAVVIGVIRNLTY